MQVRDAGSLLSGAGFTLQTVDTEDMTVQYDDAADAMTHLRARLCLSEPDLQLCHARLKAGGVELPVEACLCRVVSGES